MTFSAVFRWNVMTDKPTTSGWNDVTSCVTVCGTDFCARIRSATATLWCGSALPASEASAPFGIRIVSDGVCSNESGIEKSRTFMSRLDRDAGGNPFGEYHAGTGVFSTDSTHTGTEVDSNSCDLCPDRR